MIPRISQMSFWAVITVFAGVFLLFHGSAQGHHKIYLQDDPVLQEKTLYGGNDIPKTFAANLTFHRWALGTDGAHWVDKTNNRGGLSNHINFAIQEWKKAVPELNFIRASDSIGDLWFTVDENCFSNGEYLIRSFLDNSDHQASYVHSATICVKPDILESSATAKKDTLMHEIGHLMGLDEQYIDDGTNLFDKNGNPTTCHLYRDSVMNGPDKNGENCTGVHKPTTWDRNAVSAYWLDMGGLDKPALSRSGSSSLKIEWKDNKWTDVWQLTTLFNWDRERRTWNQLDSSLFNKGVGFHKSAIDRTLEKEWNLTANKWPSGKWYRAEVRHWNWRKEQWGPQVYSDMVYVR